MAGLNDLVTSTRIWLALRRDPVGFCTGIANQAAHDYRQGDYIAAVHRFVFVTQKIEEGYALPDDLALVCYGRAGMALASVKPNPDPALASRLLAEAVRRGLAMAIAPEELTALRVNHGHVLIDASKPREALEQFRLAETALPHDLDRLSGEADALQRLGDLDGAAAGWTRLLGSLDRFPESERPSNEAYVRERLGLLLVDADRYEQAAEALEAAVRLGPSLGSGLAPNRLNVLATLCWVNGSLGRLGPAKAAAAAWHGLLDEVGRQHTSPMQEARLLGGLGWAYVLDKNGDEAVPLLARACRLMQAAGHDDALILYRYGVALVAADAVDEAGIVSRQALAALEAPDSLTAFFVYGQLARHLIAEGRRDAGIFFHKLNLGLRRALAANGVEAAMADAIELGNDRFFRELGDALIGRGRLAEAEQIGRVLEEIELAGLIGRGFDRDARSVVLTFTSIEEGWRSELFAAIPGAGQKGPRTAARVPDLIAWVDTLADAESMAAATHVNLLELSGGKPPPGVWVVKTLTTGSTVQVILSAGDLKTFVTPDTTTQKIAEQVFLLRRALSNPGTDVTALAGSFYRILGLGLLDELRRDGVQGRTGDTGDTAPMQPPDAPRLIAFDLDGPFRYLPIAALWDGDGWLVERTAVMRIGGEVPSRDVRHDSDPAALSIAAFGTTGAHHGLPALPEVANEIAAIVGRDRDGAFPGLAALDQDFTRDRLKLAAREHPLLHVASHFEFHPTAPQRSGLLLGDGSLLSLQELWDGGFDFSGVRLATLSACETGLAGWEAGLGMNLATTLRRLGAHTVAATLWRVGDDSAARLMSRFYRELSRGAPPVEALRAAQLAQIGRPARGWDDTAAAPATMSGPWAEPFHWSGVVLIGEIDTALAPLAGRAV